MAKKSNALPINNNMQTNKRLLTCLWIVRKLEERGALSLEQINELWTDDEDISDGKEMQRRTFYNYVKGIYDLLGIVIECDRRDRMRYKIVERKDDKVLQYQLKIFATQEALANSASIRERVLLEEIPSGVEFLNPILDAMKTNSRISFEYQRFNEEVVQKVSLAEPYCVKLYHQRWYLVVKEWRTLLVSHEKVSEMHVYSLDRMRWLRMENETFRMDDSFVAEEFFRFAFGTRVEKDNPPYTVRLKVAAVQRQYLRTLPLHHSQREVETCAEYSIFELRVALTVELVMQVLYYGSLIEVLEPDVLREVVMEEIDRMRENYE